GAAALQLRRLRRRQNGQADAQEPDWSAPVLDEAADRDSPFHRWDARLKIASLFIYCFLVVSLQTLIWAAAALAISIAAVVASRIPWTRPLRRLAAMSGFLTMFLIVVPLTAPAVPGETLIVLDPFSSLILHGEGLRLATLVVLKACAIALLMEPLLATAPLAVTLQALAALRLPNAICQMILLAHRYIHVLGHEARRMHRSMRLRGFAPRTDLATLRAYGNFLGMLFVRSFDRTQRVFEAMQSRGYRGAFPTWTTFAATPADWAKGAFWIIMGFILLTMDRLNLC
ncbi:MAG TPA: cobalt ECF transporter T component CbiQ, partial [Desulfobacterales bacterium]|nr:cobalt ECF transporter T component CbiQ [Desulfobacterales bacterium]